MGIALLGTISGVVLGLPATTDTTNAVDRATPAQGDTARAAELRGVSGVKVLLVGDDGHVAGFSVTGKDGVYTIVDVKPGRYQIRPDETTFPEDFRLDTGEIPVEVRSGKDAVDLKAADLKGHYTRPRPKGEEGANQIEYKVFH